MRGLPPKVRVIEILIQLVRVVQTCSGRSFCGIPFREVEDLLVMPSGRLNRAES